ncbi:MAG TPA: hypothetical protein VG826_13890 [Pirellulales bacterium]|nr:hypothetical protein [Pirellulales bacterium]
MPVLFVLTAIAVLVLMVLVFLRAARKASQRYYSGLDWPSTHSAETTDGSLNDFVGGFVTGSMLGGMPGDVVGGMADGRQDDSPPTPHHFQQAEADQSSAYGGFEAAAQHDHGSAFDPPGGFDSSPSFDAGSGCDGGASFDCGTSFDASTS